MPFLLDNEVPYEISGSQSGVAKESNLLGM
jgi:hypothetical protein